VQVNPDPAGGQPRLTGTGNVCAMFRRGYLEMLFKTADTPLGAEFEAARARYDGLHLVAFAVADAPAAHRRLAASGLPVQPVVAMQRPVETAEGPDVAAFEVVRVVSGAMPEGRVQILRHKTERAVWQPRWLEHPNGAVGLRALAIVVADLEEAAARFSRFVGRPALRSAGVATLELDRGRLELFDPGTWRSRWPAVEIPALPFMARYDVEVESLDRVRACLLAGGLSFEQLDGALMAAFPPQLGHGLWRFVAA
jgi:hypothetical protein